MIWTIFLIAGVLSLCIAALNVGKIKQGLAHLGPAAVWTILATWLLYVPTFFLKYRPVTAFVGSLINILKIISLDAEYTACFEEISAAFSQPVLVFFYEALIAIVHLVLPVVSVLAAYNILYKWFSGLRIKAINLKTRTVFVFSQVNEKSLLLAQDVKKHFPKASVIFAKSGNQNDLDYSVRMQNFVFYQDDIQKVEISRKKVKEVFYFCMSEDEDENLNDGLSLIKANPLADDKNSAMREQQKNTHILIFSSQREMETILDSTEKGLLDIRIINEPERIVYSLLNRYPLCSHVQNKVIHILLIGFGKINEKVLRTAVWLGQLGEDCQLQIDVVGIHIDNRLADLKFRCPELFDGTYSIRGFSFKNAAEMWHHIQSECLDATYVVVDGKTDAESVENSLTARRIFYSADLKNARKPAIFARIKTAEKNEMVRNLRTGETKPENRVPYDIIPFGSDSETYVFDELVSSEIDDLTRNVHLVYESAFTKESINVDAAMERYGALEVDKRSNRANALHIRYKLNILGLDYVPCSDGQTEDEVDFNEFVPAEAVDRIAVIEHDRWMAFMRSEGWTTADIAEVKLYKENGLSAGKHKCPLLQMHPYICPFEELPARSKALGLKDSTEYDRELIRHIPDILHDKWGVTKEQYRIIKMNSGGAPETKNADDTIDDGAADANEGQEGKLWRI